MIGFEQGFLGMIERLSRPLTYRDCSGILHEGGTILGTHNKANPVRYFGANGADVSGRVQTYYDELGLDGVIVLGGDGTMSICYELSRQNMNFLGIPKTIDNDIVGTDRTFGFDTAVHIVTDAIDRLQTTGRSHNRVMILETMGRYAGWIALHAGVAGGADIVLIPEIPYDVDEVVRICQAREKRQRFSIIVVAEGAMPKGGERTVRETIPDSPDPIRLGGIGNVLRLQLEERIDPEVRTTVLGHIQRGGSPTPFDRVFATNLGCYAASLVAQEQWGRMVAVKQSAMTSVPLETCAHNTRTVPLNDMTLISALAIGTSFGDPELSKPLAHLQDPVHLI
ncbi:MAG: ATP-dependent 6-phosphofructokinase [Myxococcota bacterium]